MASTRSASVYLQSVLRLQLFRDPPEDATLLRSSAFHTREPPSLLWTGRLGDQSSAESRWAGAGKRRPRNTGHAHWELTMGLALSTEEAQLWKWVSQCRTATEGARGPNGSRPGSALYARLEAAGLEDSGHPGRTPLENRGNPESPRHWQGGSLRYRKGKIPISFLLTSIRGDSPSRPHEQDTVLPLYVPTRLVRLGAGTGLGTLCPGSRSFSHSHLHC